MKRRMQSFNLYSKEANLPGVTEDDVRDNYNTLKRFMTRIVDLVEISTSQTSGVSEVDRSARHRRPG